MNRPLKSRIGKWSLFHTLPLGTRYVHKKKDFLKKDYIYVKIGTNLVARWNGPDGSHVLQPILSAAEPENLMQLLVVVHS